MQCEHCGTTGDWLGDDATWEPVSNNGLAIVRVFECAECGNQQQAR